MEATIIFPHQLFEKHPALKNKRPVFLVEDARFFTDFSFHKQKLLLHRASMQCYQEYLKKSGYTVDYIDFQQAADLWIILKQKKIDHIYYTDLVDHVLEKRIADCAKKADIKCTVFATPMFISPLEWLDEQLGGKKRYLMRSFYTAQRKRTGILMEDGKPIGGKWSFDDENRKPLPDTVSIPKPYRPHDNAQVKKARAYVEKNFGDNPGDMDCFSYPVTFDQANRGLKDFLSNRLQFFGRYQDAIKKDEPFLFHSLLTPALNIGLITPDYVVEKALRYAQKNNVPLNSLEGFIRQIIGWREFVRGVYLFAGKKQSSANFFKLRTKISKKLWYGETGITPIDITIKRVFKYAYAHHIERLMVLGNFMLLSSISPHEVYHWFMALFIDAYDWVMVPNVYGMSQYADGGLMVTKPYISSSKYIMRMSDYKKGDWCEIWDALFWHFIITNKEVIEAVPRLRIMLAYLKKIDKKKINQYLKVAQKFL